jgi:hypothetical protein
MPNRAEAHVRGETQPPAIFRSRTNRLEKSRPAPAASKSNATCCALPMRLMQAPLMQVADACDRLGLPLPSLENVWVQARSNAPSALRMHD